MPFPGGKHSAGHYAPGAAAIFLRSTSAFYNKDVDGSPFTVSAPTRVANDQLFFLKAGFGQLLATPAGWFAFPAFTTGQLQLYFRLATNTAADDFAVNESTTRNIVGQMAVFGNALGEAGLLAPYFSGTITDNTGGAGQNTFVLGQLTEDVTPEANDLVLGIWMRNRTFTPAAPPVTLDDSGVLDNTIGKIAVQQTPTLPGNLFCGWEFTVEAGASPLIAGTNITYGPVQDFSLTTSHMQRYRY